MYNFVTDPNHHLNVKHIVTDSNHHLNVKDIITDSNHHPLCDDLSLRLRHSDLPLLAQALHHYSSSRKERQVR